MGQKQKTFDADLRLKDAGLIAASAVTQVGGVDKILDLGEARFDGRVIINATAVEVATGDETYDIVTEFSDSATFASGVFKGPSQMLGDQAPTSMGGADSDNGVGSYELAFCNELAGVIYRYMRLRTIVVGTIATGINYTAHVIPQA